ncbi:MAG: hypothetical protein WEC34_09955 [Acidimicrobiia bacterium]
MAETPEDVAKRERAAMEQRRTIEISLFGALTSFQIALAALALGRSDTKSAEPTYWFVAVTSVVLLVLYVLVVVKIEILNADSRKHWLEIERPGIRPRTGMAQVRTMWAAWPVGPAIFIGVALLVLLGALPNR